MPSVGANQSAKESGSWKTWSKFWAKHNGSWKRPISVFAKSGGIWKEVWDETPTVTNISRNVSSYNPDEGLFVTNTSFTLAANGFQTSITVDGSFVKNENADSVTFQSFAKLTVNPNDSPTVVVANTSGSVSF